jgi:hypothetical protein
MKVWILRRANRNVNGLLPDDYEPGEVYDVSPSIGAYLVEHGMAIVEMRRHDYERRGSHDRRRKHYTYPPPNDDLNA